MGENDKNRTTDNTRYWFRMGWVFKGIFLNGSGTKILLDFWIYNHLRHVFYCIYRKRKSKTVFRKSPRKIAITARFFTLKYYGKRVISRTDDRKEIKSTGYARFL
jgi:hypothetical protein